MPAPGRFGAVICAMVTPFDGDGRLDIDGAVKLARWLVENGNDGLVLTGTTGEATTMSDVEKLELWKAVRGAVGVPVIAGTGTASTAHSVELTRLAAAAGCRRRPGRHALLQPPLPGRDRRPLPGHRGARPTCPSSPTTSPSVRAASSRPRPCWDWLGTGP